VLALDLSETANRILHADKTPMIRSRAEHGVPDPYKLHAISSYPLTGDPAENECGLDCDDLAHRAD